MKQKPATGLNWRKMRDFSKSEFPDGALKLTDEQLILALAHYRDLLGHTITPSLNPDGWARTSGSEGSEHYAVGRLSRAGDIFVSRSVDVRHAFMLACQIFGGVGIYYDTQLMGKPHIMFHVDMREEPLVWCRHKGEYFYPANGGKEADTFFHLLNRGLAVE